MGATNHFQETFRLQSLNVLRSDASRLLFELKVNTYFAFSSCREQINSPKNTYSQSASHYDSRIAADTRPCFRQVLSAIPVCHSGLQYPPSLSLARPDFSPFILEALLKGRQDNAATKYIQRLFLFNVSFFYSFVFRLSLSLKCDDRSDVNMLLGSEACV